MPQPSVSTGVRSLSPPGPSAEDSCPRGGLAAGPAHGEGRACSRSSQPFLPSPLSWALASAGKMGSGRMPTALRSGCPRRFRETNVISPGWDALVCGVFSAHLPSVGRCPGASLHPLATQVPLCTCPRRARLPCPPDTAVTAALGPPSGPRTVDSRLHSSCVKPSLLCTYACCPKTTASCPAVWLRAERQPCT